MSFHLLEPSVLLCEMGQMLTVLRMPAGRPAVPSPGAGSTPLHPQPRSLQKHSCLLSISKPFAQISSISTMATEEGAEVTWSLRNSLALGLAFLPCRAAREHVALENGTKRYAHKLYRHVKMEP